MALITRNPTSDISALGTWSGTSGSRYTLVNDYPSTDTGDLLNHGTSAGSILFGFQQISLPTGTTINAVHILYYDREAASGNNNFGSQIRIGTTTYSSATHNPTTTTTLQTDTWTTNPATGTAWTAATVANINAFGFRSTDANPVVSLLSAVIEVDYTPRPTLDQSNYRFYEYGAENSSVALENQNTALTVNKTAGPDNVLLRVMLQETAGGAGLSTDDFRLEYSINDSQYTQLASSVTGLRKVVGSTDFINQAQLSSTNTKISQSFKPFTTGALVYIWIFSLGADSWGDNTVSIYEHSGTFGVDGVPTGTPLAVSNYNGGVAPDYKLFGFINENQITLNKDTAYTFVIEYVNSAQNIDTSPTNTEGNSAIYNGSSWSIGSRDLYYLMDIVPSQVAASPYSAEPLTEGQATTSRLTGGTGSFVAGKVSLDGVANDLAITANNYTELVYGLTVNKSYLTAGDQLKFRIVSNEVPFITFTHTEYPTINITAGSGQQDTAAMLMMFF
jgi:hypothetical protein